MKLRRMRRAVILPGLALILFVVVTAGAVLGPVALPVDEVLRIILAKAPLVGARIARDWAETDAAIVLDIRLPRVVLSALVGGALGLAGTAFQGLFRNPMADPYVVGVSAGAALGATVAILFGLPQAGLGFGAIPVMAFAGALVTVMLVYRLAAVRGRATTVAMVLAGLAVSSVITAVVSFLMLMSGDKLEQLIYWLMGSLSGRTWSDLYLALPYITLGGAVVILFARDLNALLLGDEPALHLGIEVEPVQKIILAAASLVTAAAVAVSGLIGFVGLVVPHVARFFFGPDHRLLLPAAALSGAITLVLADVVARTIIKPQEVPVGIVTALVGGPFFLYLLRKREGERPG